MIYSIQKYFSINIKKDELKRKACNNSNSLKLQEAPSHYVYSVITGRETFTGVYSQLVVYSGQH